MRIVHIWCVIEFEHDQVNDECEHGQVNDVRASQATEIRNCANNFRPVDSSLLLAKSFFVGV